MFGLGPAEVILVLVIALIVFGPGRLPEIGQALGKSIREFRDASSEITQELSREIEATERAARGETESTKQGKPTDATREIVPNTIEAETESTKQEKPTDDSE